MRVTYETLIQALRLRTILRKVCSFVSPEKRHGIVKFLRSKAKARSIRRAISGADANLDDIEAFVLKHAAPMHAPLVLISQVHRSGGTLLSQLFDGHPALAAHPHELKIGHPTSEDWPNADPALGPAQNFQTLFEANTIGMMRNGYTKGRQDAIRRSFFLVPRLQYQLFRHLWDSLPPSLPRDIFEHFFSAYFNAWINYQGCLEQKKWITVFAPRLAHREINVERFFRDYPDGKLIQIIRDPTTWYPSVKHHYGELSGQRPEAILEPWLRSAEAILRNRERFGGKVIVIRFEELVSRTEVTMRRLSELLGVDYDAMLCKPTFNGQPLRANSSFTVKGTGVIVAPLERWKMLSKEERRLIEKRCCDLHRRTLALALDVDDVMCPATNV